MRVPQRRVEVRPAALVLEVIDREASVTAGAMELRRPGVPEKMRAALDAVAFSMSSKIRPAHEPKPFSVNAQPGSVRNSGSGLLRGPEYVGRWSLMYVSISATAARSSRTLRSLLPFEVSQRT